MRSESASLVEHSEPAKEKERFWRKILKKQTLLQRGQALHTKEYLTCGSPDKEATLGQVIKILSSSSLYCETIIQGIVSRASGHLLLLSILLRMQVNYRISNF